MRNFARINNYYNRLEAVKDWRELFWKACELGCRDLAIKHKPKPNSSWRKIDEAIKNLREDLEKIAMMPKRIQRKRTKGWRMPANTVYVGRPTHWGNPFIARPGETEQDVVNAFEENIDPASMSRIKEKLKGKNLACWCPLDQPCHADVLLRLANDPTPTLPETRVSGTTDGGSNPPRLAPNWKE